MGRFLKVWLFVTLLLIVHLNAEQEIVFPGGILSVSAFDVSTGDRIDGVKVTVSKEDTIYFTDRHNINRIHLKSGTYSLYFEVDSYHDDNIDSICLLDDTLSQLSVWLKPNSIKEYTHKGQADYRVKKSEIKRSIISGQVIDKTTKLPVSGVDIYIQLLDTIFIDKTDSSGSYLFLINKILNGKSRFQFSHPDYYPLIIETKNSVYTYSAGGVTSLVEKKKSLDRLNRNIKKQILLTVSTHNGGMMSSSKIITEEEVRIGDGFLIESYAENSVRALLNPIPFQLVRIINSEEIIVQYDKNALRCSAQDVEHVSPNQVRIGLEEVGFSTKIDCGGTTFSIKVAKHKEHDIK